MLVLLILLGSLAIPANASAMHGECSGPCNYVYMKKVVKPYNAKINRMAYCESGQSGHIRWHLNTNNGYFGGLQFSKRTWRSVGGHLYPHQNRPLVQKYRAVKLIRRYGYGQWPVCGSR